MMNPTASKTTKALVGCHNSMFFLMIGLCIGFFTSSWMKMIEYRSQEMNEQHNILTILKDFQQKTKSCERRDSNNTKSDYGEEKGWKLMHVYVGDHGTNYSDHIADSSFVTSDYFQQNVWFSQYKQDYIIASLLRYKTNGYFIDLAANDPIRISNTYSLERYYNWDGLTIEPNPIYWNGLTQRKCQVVAAVVGRQKDEEVQFKFPKRRAPLAGIVGKQFKNKQSNPVGNRTTDEEVHYKFTVTLLEIFQRFLVPEVIDYISLDVEGAETFIMESFPFDLYRFNILTVEKPDIVLTKLLNTNGYTMMKLLKQNSGEQLWIRDDIKDSLDLTALEIDVQSYKYRE